MDKYLNKIYIIAILAFFSLIILIYGLQRYQINRLKDEIREERAKDFKRLEKSIKYQQLEIIEYEKEIKTIRDVAINSKSVNLDKFDSIRANFKRHLDSLRLLKE